MARTVEVTRSNPVKSSVRNDYKSAEVGLRFFVPVSASGYTITVKDVPLSNAPNYKSWDGRHNIYIFAVNAVKRAFSYFFTVQLNNYFRCRVHRVSTLTKSRRRAAHRYRCTFLLLKSFMQPMLHFTWAEVAKCRVNQSK